MGVDLKPVADQSPPISELMLRAYCPPIFSPLLFHLPFNPPPHTSHYGPYQNTEMNENIIVGIRAGGPASCHYAIYMLISSVDGGAGVAM